MYRRLITLLLLTLISLGLYASDESDEGCVPSSAYLYIDYGMLGGDPKERLADFDTLLKSCNTTEDNLSSNSGASYILGLLYYKANDIQKSKKHLENAAKTKKFQLGELSFEKNFMLGQIAYQENKKEVAKEYFQKAFEGYFSIDCIIDKYDTAYLESDLIESGVPMIKELYGEKSLEMGKLYSMLIEYFCFEKKNKEALKYLLLLDAIIDDVLVKNIDEKYSTSKEDLMMYLYAGYALNNDKENADKYYKKIDNLQKAGKHRDDVDKFISKIYIQNGDFEKGYEHAKKYHDKALKAYENNSTAAFSGVMLYGSFRDVANAALNLKKYKEAENYFNENKKYMIENLALLEKENRGYEVMMEVAMAHFDEIEYYIKVFEFEKVKSLLDEGVAFLRANKPQKIRRDFGQVLIEKVDEVLTEDRY